jgi:hypothetical protein
LNESQTKGFDRPLSVCDELREELGLDEDESLRLLRQDERTILVEHLRETSGFAIRWDRDLVLSANVRASAGRRTEHASPVWEVWLLIVRFFGSRESRLHAPRRSRVCRFEPGR